MDPGSTFGQNINILAVSPATGESKALTTDGLSYQPEVSPVEGLVAFSRMVRDKPGQGVWVMQPDGTGGRRLASGSAPTWAPDGSRLAFLDPAGSAGGVPVMVIAKDGSALAKVVQAPGVRSLAWAADGEHLLYLADDKVGQNTLRRLWVVKVDGTSAKSLTQDNESCEAALWAPAGVEMVAMLGPAEYGAGRSLYRIDLEGHRRPLVSGPGLQVIGISWSPLMEAAMADAWLNLAAGDSLGPRGAPAAGKPPGQSASVTQPETTGRTWTASKPAGGPMPQTDSTPPVPKLGPPRDEAMMLRLEGERLQATGDYRQALEIYRRSLNLHGDPKLEGRARRIEAYLEVRP